jgi:hypothetical protein
MNRKLILIVRLIFGTELNLFLTLKNKVAIISDI